MAKYGYKVKVTNLKTNKSFIEKFDLQVKANEFIRFMKERDYIFGFRNSYKLLVYEFKN